jgi:hypothetical protein
VQLVQLVQLVRLGLRVREPQKQQLQQHLLS